jgi:glycosyltransferase involved in cell wall biosynthesis
MLVCDSAAVRTKAQALVPYPDERIVQFPWGIDLGAYRPGAGDSPVRKRLGWQDNRVVLSTRAWEKLHGIDVLLEAFRQAHNSDAGLRLLLLGTGSARREVREFIGRHGLADVVYCAGQVAHAEVLGHYQAADVYVSCARSDGASISLLEAMAAGLLVVVSDIPGNREWVQPGVNGWLGGDGDPSSFAAALLAAANLEEAGRAAFRERNRGLVCERADWHRNIETILVAYDRLLR